MLKNPFFAFPAIFLLIKSVYMEVNDMNIGILLVAVVGGIAGLFSTLYLAISLPVVLIWKVYRKIHLGIPITK